MLNIRNAVWTDPLVANSTSLSIHEWRLSEGAYCKYSERMWPLSCPQLTSCYSCDMSSHKSVQSDTGVRWPTDPGLVLVDKLNAFDLNTACQSFPVNRAGLRHGWMWHCGAMCRQPGPLRGQQEAGGRHHNSSSVHTQALPTNSKCKAQGALNIMTTCLQRGEGIGWSKGAQGAQRARPRAI